jgi:hypothetical protein
MTALSNTSRLCGYSVVINTPQWLSEQVENIHYEFIEKDSGRKRKKPVISQIPLVNLLSTDSESSDEKVLFSIRKVTSMVHCFDLSYTGFSFFDAGEALHINVSDQNMLVSLRSLLECELQPCQLLADTPKPAFIASSSTAGNEAAAAVHYRFTDVLSTNNFRVSSLSILKKVAGSEGWQLLKELPFGRA